MTKRKRSARLVVLIAVIMAVLVAEALLVAAVFVSPSAGNRLQSVVAGVSRAWTGSEGSPGIPARVADVFDRGYQNWIAPLWSAPQAPKGDREFTACVSCHRDYAARRKFSSVYMNHPLHAELGVACGTCHPENTHPNPPLPVEKTCVTCHAEVREKGKCGTCHPPASLPHFYLLGAPREGVVQCDVCHPKRVFTSTATQPLVHVRSFSGTDQSVCLSCHQTTTCRQCHAAQHPSNWVSTHGGVVGMGSQVTCFACHTNEWCADSCHNRSPTQPFVPRPMPTAGIRP